MKKILYLSFLVCLLLINCKTIEPAAQELEDAQLPGEQVVTENEQAGSGGLGIKVVGPPAPMFAPSSNILASRAYDLGTQYLRENRLADAERYLKEAIELDPVFVDAMDHLGMVYRRQNRLAEAEAMYLRSIELNRENKVPFMNLAVVYRLQNRLNEALDLYKIVIQLDQNDPEGYYGIGELFYMVGDYRNAIPFFDKSIELYNIVNSPYVYDAYFYRGMMYFRMEDYDAALRYLEEARKANPDNATIENTLNEIRNRKI